MFEKVTNFDNSVPVYQKHSSAYRWPFLFLYDQLFGLSNRVKNKSGKVLKKLENKTRISSKYLKLHEKNVEHLLKDNKDFTANEPLPLPELNASEFNKEIFRPWKKKINTPLVIRGFLKDAPIRDLFSIENLTSTYGEKEIKCTTDVKDEGETRAGQNLQTVSAKLKDFILSEKYLNYYINNFYGILSDEDFLKLCKGKEIDDIQGKGNIFTQWFISRNQSTGSTLHCASADNMFLNIKGRKEWHFIHPSYSPIMQATLSKYGIFAVSEMKESISGDFYKNIIKSYPYMKSVPIYKVVLEEGDLLFNPPWWWHTVRNKEDFTVGCATRYWEANHSSTNSPTLAMGLQAEVLKHPKKSALYLTLSSLRNKKNASKYIDSIFSGTENKLN